MIRVTLALAVVGAIYLASPARRAGGELPALVGAAREASVRAGLGAVAPSLDGAAGLIAQELGRQATARPPGRRPGPEVRDATP